MKSSSHYRTAHKILHVFEICFKRSSGFRELSKLNLCSNLNIKLARLSPNIYGDIKIF